MVALACGQPRGHLIRVLNERTVEIFELFFCKKNTS